MGKPSITIKPDWHYFHLELRCPNTQDILCDYLTWKRLFNAALQQYYGIIGESTHVDFLHMDGATSDRGHQVWVRVPYEDFKMFKASITTYTVDSSIIGITHLQETDPAAIIAILRDSSALSGVSGPIEDAWY